MEENVIMTESVAKFLREHQYGSQDGKNGEAKVACRLFMPFSHAFTFYVLEGYDDTEESGIVYGYVVNNLHPECSEYGDIDLHSLMSHRTYGCPSVERDIAIPVGTEFNCALEMSNDPKPSWWD